MAAARCHARVDGQFSLLTLTSAADKALALLGAGDRVLLATIDRRGTGAVLRAYATQDGSSLGEWPLPAVPVRDGIAAAGGRLYLSARDGTLYCLGR